MAVPDHVVKFIDKNKHYVEIRGNEGDPTRINLDLFCECPHLEGGACGPCGKAFALFVFENAFITGYTMAQKGLAIPKFELLP